MCVWRISKESIYGNVHSVTRESCVWRTSKESVHDKVR